MQVPIGWPDDVKFINGVVYQNSPTSTSEIQFPKTRLAMHLEIFNVGKDSPAYVADSSSPAYPGRGVRSKSAIAGNQVLGYYAGVCRPVIFQQIDSSYAFDVKRSNSGLQPEEGFVVDALDYGNMMRFINDPRSTGKQANVVSNLVKLPFFPFLSIQIRTAPQGIEAGEELLMDYHVTDPGYWGNAPVLGEFQDVDRSKSKDESRKRSRDSPGTDADDDQESDSSPKVQPCAECGRLLRWLQDHVTDDHADPREVQKTVVTAWFDGHYSKSSGGLGESVTRATLLAEINTFLVAMGIPKWKTYKDWFIKEVVGVTDDNGCWELYRRDAFAPHGRLEFARDAKQRLEEVVWKLKDFMGLD